MVKMVNFMLCTFYYNFINKETPGSRRKKKKEKRQSNFQMLRALWNWAATPGAPGKYWGVPEPRFQRSQGFWGGCEDTP